GESSDRVTGKQYERRITNNWSPRFGVAWSPGSSRKWSVRGGAGLYYDWVTIGESSDRVNVNAPNFVFPNMGQLLPIRPVFSLGTSDTFPFGFTLPTIPAGRLDERGGIAGLQTNVGGLDPRLKAPRVINYIAAVERELPGRTVVGLNYSGSRTTRGLVGTDYNRFPGDLADGRFDRLNPSFGTMFWVSNFNEITYNALIATVRKDLRTNGVIQASYTYGRATDFFQGGARSVSLESVVDPRQLGDRRAPTAFDVTHRLSASGVYRLPTPFKSNVLAKTVLGGWEVGTTVIAQTGTPFTIFNGNPLNAIFEGGRVVGFRPGSGDYNLDGFNFDFPNVPNNLPQKVDRNQFLGDNSNRPRINAADFTAPAVGVQGNSPRNAFRQQGLLRVDSSVIKNNRLPFLGEQGNLQLKFEFFNVLNRVNLGGITNNLGSVNFGRILGQGDPRIIQVGARIAF
ncbi:MAG TPA: hypothetical protein DEH78_29755, partial [Solibacterales bacterium]|nr:hypothetical protein [Bryobacterales bacterium]